MSDKARKNSAFPDPVPPFGDEGSVIRPRDAADNDGQRPAPPELSPETAPATRRSQSSTRPAQGSLDDRLEQKMLRAGRLLRDLSPSDARVRLLYVAVMRRDETLLDGVLAELNKLLPPA